MENIIKNLKNELLNEELNFIELDTIMVNNGFYSVLDDGIINDIKQDLNVVYSLVETDEATIIINFKITIDSGKDEIKESFYIKVVNIELF